eukprot:4667074-Prymnesium_polylepis.1
MACKSCLCGPCEQYGTDTFLEMEATVRKMRLGSQQEKNFLERINQMRSYLNYDYRRYCSLSSHTATACIVYALSADASEWCCGCDHDHRMQVEKDNERFHLLDDLLARVEKRRAPLVRVALAA